MDVLLRLQLHHHVPHLLVYSRELALFPSGPHLELGPEAIDQLAQLRVFVEELGVVLEEDVHLGLDVQVQRGGVNEAVACGDRRRKICILLVGLGRVEVQCSLGDCGGVPGGSGIAQIAFMGSD